MGPPISWPACLSKALEAKIASERGEGDTSIHSIMLSFLKACTPLSVLWGRELGRQGEKRGIFESQEEEGHTPLS